MDELLGKLAHLMNHRHEAGDDGFSELMEKILSPWPDVGWELGPDLVDPDIERLSLFLSGVLEPDAESSLAARLPLTEQGWIISLGIPPRDWDIYFEATMNGQDFDIEGREWFWSMADAGDQVTLTIAPPDQFGNLTDEELRDLAGIILAGELGESNVRTLVRWFDVSPTRQGAGEWLPMESLRKKFVEKFPDCEYSGWLATSR